MSKTLVATILSLSSIALAGCSAKPSIRTQSFPDMDISQLLPQEDLMPLEDVVDGFNGGELSERDTWYNLSKHRNDLLSHLSLGELFPTDILFQGITIDKINDRLAHSNRIIFPQYEDGRLKSLSLLQGSRRFDSYFGIGIHYYVIDRVIKGPWENRPEFVGDSFFYWIDKRDYLRKSMKYHDLLIGLIKDEYKSPPMDRYSQVLHLATYEYLTDAHNNIRDRYEFAKHFSDELIKDKVIKIAARVLANRESTSQQHRAKIYSFAVLSESNPYLNFEQYYLLLASGKTFDPQLDAAISQFKKGAQRIQHDLIKEINPLAAGDPILTYDKKTLQDASQRILNRLISP